MHPTMDTKSRSKHSRKPGRKKEKEPEVENALLDNFSVIVAYMTGISFGFHLTALEIIKKLYFVDGKMYTMNMFYIIASLLFLSPIAGSLLYSCVDVLLHHWIGLILFAHAISGLGLILHYYVTLLLFRCVAGIAIGLSTVVVPQYISRVKEKNRGFFVFLFQVALLIGILVGQVLSYFASTVSQSCAVHVFFFIFNIVFASLSLFIRKIQNKRHKGETRGIFDLFSKKTHLRSIFLAFCIHIGQQMTGINGIIVYSNTLLGKGDMDPQIRTIMVGVFSLVVTLVSSMFVDVFGRKILLIASSIVVAIALIIITTKKYVLIAILLFQFGYSFGLGPITWLLTNELFPLSYQQIANSICGSVNWLCGFITVAFFEYFYLQMGNVLIWFYVVCMTIFSIVFLFFYRETKGKDPNFQ